MVRDSLLRLEVLNVLLGKLGEPAVGTVNLDAWLDLAG